MEHIIIAFLVGMWIERWSTVILRSIHKENELTQPRKRR